LVQSSIAAPLNESVRHGTVVVRASRIGAGHECLFLLVENVLWGPMSDYVVRTESVLYAAERLRDAVTSGGSVEDAIDRLERNANLHEEQAESQRAFMFEELDAAPGPAETSETMDAALAVALADLEVGNVLLAAGQAVGETQARSESGTLDRAVRDLGRTTDLLRRGSEGAMDERRFAFEEDTGGEAVHSADGVAALAMFGTRSRETIDDVVRGTSDIASSVIEQLSKLKIDDVQKALSTVGESQVLPKLGRLVRLGARKIDAAIGALLRLLGSESLKRSRSAVEEFVEQARPQGVRIAIVEMVLGIAETRNAVDAVLARTDHAADALDRASDELARVRAAFATKKKFFEGIASAIALAGTLGTLIFGPTVALFSATAFVLVLAGAFLVAMDFADSRDILRRVHGVGEIALALG